MEYYDDNLLRIAVQKQMVNRQLKIQALHAFLGNQTENNSHILIFELFGTSTLVEVPKIE